MDTETLKALADTKFKHDLYRKNLRERVETQLLVTHNGGLFKASPELIAFINCWDSEEIFLEDQYHNPIKCDKEKLLLELKQAYQYALNAWHIEFEQSKKIRNGSQV